VNFLLTSFLLIFRPEPVLPRKNLLSQRGASISCFSPGFKTSEDSFEEGEIAGEGGNRARRARRGARKRPRGCEVVSTDGGLDPRP